MGNYFGYNTDAVNDQAYEIGTTLKSNSKNPIPMTPMLIDLVSRLESQMPNIIHDYVHELDVFNFNVFNLYGKHKIHTKYYYWLDIKFDNDTILYASIKCDRLCLRKWLDKKTHKLLNTDVIIEYIGKIYNILESLTTYDISSIINTVVTTIPNLIVKRKNVVNEDYYKTNDSDVHTISFVYSHNDIFREFDLIIDTNIDNTFIRLLKTEYGTSPKNSKLKTANDRSFNETDIRRIIDKTINLLKNS